MEHRAGSGRRGMLPSPRRIFTDTASLRAERAWIERVADMGLHTRSARLAMAIFDDDLIDEETGDFALPPGMPAPAAGGWRAVGDFVALGAFRSADRALLTLRRLVLTGYLEQLAEHSDRPLFRPLGG